MSKFVNKILLEAGGISGNIFDVVNPSACAVYNADEKKLIGIFSAMSIAGKFIYGNTVNKNLIKSISDATRTKVIIKKDKNVLSCNIAVRVANSKQKEELSNKQYIIFDDNIKQTKEFEINIKSKEDNKNLPDREKTEHQYWNDRNKLDKSKVLSIDHSNS